MTPVQENLLKLLKEIDAICKKHDITYYLAGGTALGAVRNNGFLPWDDDIDLYITRDNWLKLEKVIDSELREDRAFVSVLRSRKYQNPIPRYVDLTTATIYRVQALAGVACGQHIEFMVMDPVPRDPEKYKEFRKLLLVYTELLTSYFVVNRQVANKDSEFDPETYRYYRDMMNEKGRDEVLKLLEDKLFCYSDSDDECDYYCLRWGLHILMYERKNYRTPRLERFEDFMAPVGCCAEGIFREAYGDTWMMIPTVTEQETHESVRSMKFSYVNYIDDYLQFLDKDEAFENYLECKRIRMDNIVDRDQNTSNRFKIMSVRDRMHIENGIKKAGADPQSLLDSGRYKEMHELFDEYYKRQLTGDYIKYQGFIDLDDDTLYPALMLLIIDGRYYHARKILKIYHLNREAGEKIKAAEEIAEAMRSLSIAIYDRKSLDEAAAICREWQPKQPEIIDLKRADLQVGLYYAREKSDNEACLEKADRLLKKYKDDGEIMKLRGDALLALGREEEAVLAYLDAREHTRNGIVLNEMRKKLIWLGADEELIASAPLL